MAEYETDNATEEELAAMPSETVTDEEIPDQTAEVLEGGEDVNC